MQALRLKLRQNQENHKSGRHLFASRDVTETAPMEVDNLVPSFSDSRPALQVGEFPFEKVIHAYRNFPCISRFFFF